MTVLGLCSYDGDSIELARKSMREYQRGINQRISERYEQTLYRVNEKRSV